MEVHLFFFLSIILYSNRTIHSSHFFFFLTFFLLSFSQGIEHIYMTAGMLIKLSGTFFFSSRPHRGRGKFQTSHTCFKRVSSSSHGDKTHAKSSNLTHTRCQKHRKDKQFEDNNQIKQQVEEQTLPECYAAR